MITAKFLLSANGGYRGFSVSGHAGTDEYGKDVLCAAVSSAVMLTVNTIADFMKSECNVQSGQDSVKLILESDGGVSYPRYSKDIASEKIIASLENHLRVIDSDYHRIKIMRMEKIQKN